MELEKNKIDSKLALMEYVSPQTLAIFWVTARPLSEMKEFFPLFDYFFDGIFQKQSDSIMANDQSLYRTNNFGSDLYLCHIINKADAVKRLEDQLDIILKKKGVAQKEILVLKSEDFTIPKLWSKKFQELSFKIFPY
jgi:hypothetical protein